MFDVDLIRQDFPGTHGQVYLNSASIGLPAKSATDAVRRVSTLLAQGPAGMGYKAYYEELGKPGPQARKEVAKLLNARREEIALIGDTTMGLNLALSAIPFSAGDNLVLCDLEYPQVAISAAHAQRHQTVEVRVVSHRGGFVTIEDFKKLIDHKTRAIIVSAVQWINGLRMDLAAFSQLARERGIFLVVDAIQQLGVVPLDLSKLQVDFLAAGGQKWLNAPFNVGVLYVRDEIDISVEPTVAHGLSALAEPEGGWAKYLGDPELTPFLSLPMASDARRFETHGMPRHLGTAGLAEAVTYFNRLDPKAVVEYVRALGDFLIEELTRRGIKVWTPKARHLRSGIVSCEPFPVADKVHELDSVLQGQQIYTTVRYCSRIGGLRISIHYYTSLEDLRMFLDVLDVALKHIESV